MFGGLMSRWTMPASCDGREAAAELLRDLEARAERDDAAAVEDVAQRRPGHVLHREEADALRLAEVVRADDVAVRDLPREADLLLERLRRARPFVERVREKDLERDLVVQLAVDRAVDGPHPALAREAP